MSATPFAPALLSLLAAQGLDIGDAVSAYPGERTTPARNGQALITLVLDGVVARLGPDGRLSHGLAACGAAINLEAATQDARPDAAPSETALWVTPGRFIAVPAVWLGQRLAADVLSQMILADLRARNAALQTELTRHATRKVTQRLAALLLDIATLGGVDQVCLRQSDLADLMAVRRASISVASTELCTTGAIRLRRGAVQIWDRQALAAAAGCRHSTVTDLARLRG